MAAVDLHDALLPPLFEAHGGQVFKNMGDAYCVAFPAALPALRAAIAAQRALADQSWDLPQPLRVRVALHTGPAQMRGDDFRGLALSRAARLMKIAHGGQILASEAAEAGLRRALPEDISFLSLGSVRLPSLERPERVYQVVAPGLERTFPGLRSLENLPNNLKDQLTSFIGREREMAEVIDLCRSRRLVTLTGTGGCGKTRLALQAAAELIDNFDDGVWLVELAGITNAADVPSAVAVELKVRQEGGQSVEDALIASLKSRRLLLILDNCEHLIDASARLAQTLLQDMLGLKILATSRERLNIGGETVWRVPPLSGPAGRGGAALETLLESDAVSLFVERATAAQPQFRLSAGNAKAVAQVCRRLEGLPLALELAASRLGVIPVEQFAMRLDDRLRVLPPGPRGGAARQRTLQATLDWSYELLTEQERLLLCRLSVFAGGCTLEAVESVCTGEGIGEFETLDLLSHLIDKSLIVPEEQDGTARYRLLETLRSYSQEKLSLGAGTEDDLRRRHAAYYLAWAEAAEMHLSGAEQADWLNKIGRDQDNLRAALNFLGDTDAEAFQRLAVALYYFWYTRGYLTEGRGWLETAVRKAGETQTLIRAKALNRAGLLAWVQGDFDQASTRFTGAMEICRALGDDARVATVMSNLSMIATNRGEFDTANQLLHEALSVFRRIGDDANAARVILNLGVTAAESGAEESAIAYYQESLGLYQSLGEEENAAHVLRCLGEVLYRSGRREEADRILRESLAACIRFENRVNIAAILSYLGYLALDHGDPKTAVRLIAAGDSVRLSVGLHEPRYNVNLRGLMIERTKRVLMPEAYDAAWQEGTALSLSEACALALQPAS